jgi:hypothetical protein
VRGYSTATQGCSPIRLDEDLVDYFGTIADRSGGKVGYHNVDQFGAAQFRRGENPEVGSDSPAHYS